MVCPNCSSNIFQENTIAENKLEKTHWFLEKCPIYGHVSPQEWILDTLIKLKYYLKSLDIVLFFAIISIFLLVFLSNPHINKRNWRNVY